MWRDVRATCARPTNFKVHNALPLVGALKSKRSALEDGRCADSRTAVVVQSVLIVDVPTFGHDEPSHCNGHWPPPLMFQRRNQVQSSRLMSTHRQIARAVAVALE